MKFFSKKNKGFSLIELLVILTVVTILATISAYNLSSSRVKGRDTKRISDMGTINLALHAYFNDHGSYPTVINFGQPLTNAAGTKTYLQQIPTNPTPRTDHNCPDREYVYRISPTDNTSYSLLVCAGLENDASKPRLIYSNEEGLFHCGDLITDLDNFTYRTISIGTQCWMAQNLRSKTKPDGTCLMGGGLPPCPDASPTDLNTGRTCYQFSEDNCIVRNKPFPSIDGAFYTWNAAMNGSTVEGAQGICPTGWHVPSDNEWYILESFLTNSGQPCSPSRMGPSSTECNGSAKRLRYPIASDPTVGTSGFNGILNGVQAIIGGTLNFYYTNVESRWITSTEQGSNKIIRMIWPTDYIRLWRTYDPKEFGESLRCVKD